LPNFGLVQPGIPGAHQGAVVGNAFEAGEVLFDAGAHAVVDRTLFGAQFGRGDQGKAHEWLLMGLGTIMQCMN
jgi:hypothetical protein